MLPATITIAGLNTKPGFAQYPASLVLTKVGNSSTETRYTSDSIPLTVGGVARAVVGRVAVVTMSHKAVGKQGASLTSLVRTVLPKQGNEAATVIADVDDGFETETSSSTRTKSGVPSGTSDAWKSVRNGVLTDAVILELANGNL